MDVSPYRDVAGNPVDPTTLRNLAVHYHQAGDIETADRLRDQFRTADPTEYPEGLSTESIYIPVSPAIIQANTLPTPTYPPPGTYRPRRSVPLQNQVEFLIRFFSDYNLTAGDPDPANLEETHQQLVTASRTDLLGEHIRTYDPNLPDPHRLTDFWIPAGTQTLYTYQKRLYLTERPLVSEDGDRTRFATSSFAADPTPWIQSASYRWSGYPAPQIVESATGSHVSPDSSIAEAWAERHTTPKDPERSGGELILHETELLCRQHEEYRYGLWLTYETYLDRKTGGMFIRRVETNTWENDVMETWDAGMLGLVTRGEEIVFFPVGQTPAAGTVPDIHTVGEQPSRDNVTSR